MRNLAILSCVFVLSATPSAVVSALDLETVSGRKYTNVEFGSTDEKIVEIIHDQGIDKIAVSELPEAFRKDHFDPFLKKQQQRQKKQEEAQPALRQPSKEVQPPRAQTKAEARRLRRQQQMEARQRLDERKKARVAGEKNLIYGNLLELSPAQPYQEIAAERQNRDILGSAFGAPSMRRGFSIKPETISLR
ncbi:MAG: hypothetical protein PHS41_07355 [Victivallaceae bacterium]|nr:hypothetical protein [Victivallaceae bacterium]